MSSSLCPPHREPSICIEPTFFLLSLASVEILLSALGRSVSRKRQQAVVESDPKSLKAYFEQEVEREVNELICL